MNNLEQRINKQQEKIKQEAERLNQLKAQQAKKLQAIKFRDNIKERKALAHLKHTLGGMVYKMGLGELPESLLLGLFLKNHSFLNIATPDNIEALKAKGLEYVSKDEKTKKAKTLEPLKIR